MRCIFRIKFALQSKLEHELICGQGVVFNFSQLGIESKLGIWIDLVCTVNEPSCANLTLKWPAIAGIVACSERAQGTKQYNGKETFHREHCVR